MMHGFILPMQVDPDAAAAAAESVWTPGLVAFLFGLAAFLAIYAMFAPVNEISDEDAYGGVLDELNPVDPNAKQSSFDRLIRPVIRNVLPQTPMSALVAARNNTKIHELLVRSGNPWNLRPEEFVGVRIIGAAVGFLLLLWLSVNQMLTMIPVWAAMALGIYMGQLAPKSLLSSKKGARQKGAQKGLPEALDLLRITMNAGQTLQPAITEVSLRIPEGIIKDELLRVSDDLRSGKPLQRALEDFARRAPSDEVEAFCRSVMQAERLGSDVTDTLAAQSAAARSAFEALIDKKTAQLQTTLMFPIMLFMLPALMIAILAPAISSIARTF